MTDLPDPLDPHPRLSGLRQAALGAVGFVATLVLLFGLSSLAGRTASDGSVAGSPSSAVAGSRAPGSSATPLAIASAASSAIPTVASTIPPGPSPSGDPVLVGAGDIAVCGLDGDQATADLIAGIPGTVFTAGDNAYESGSAAEFRACYEPTWGRFLARTRPAPGNHDHNTKDLAGYLGYYGTAAAPDGASWYSFDLGAWHVVVLDSSCGDVGGCEPGSAQGAWLAADLAASAASCTLAIWHHPRFSSGVHGNDTSVDPFWRALYAAGADVVINGHDHDYERFAPQDPDGREDRARGLREFVVGTGGVALRDFERVAANSELRVAVAHGVLALTLRDGGYDWQFHPTATDFSDRGTARCH